MDLEEGELTSDDDFGAPPAPTNSLEIHIPDILDDTDYVILDRPKSSLPKSTSDTASPAETSLQQQQANAAQPSTAFGGFHSFGASSGSAKKSYYDGRGIGDLIDSSDKESSSSDNSDDETLGKAKRTRMTLPKGNAATSPFTPSATTTSLFPRDELNLFNKQAAKFQNERKPNLIWSNVIQEEQISSCFEGVRVIDTGFGNIDVARGPESYSFQRKPREPRQRRESDSSDISSEGLSDNALHYLRGGDFSYDDDETETTEESSEHALPTSFTSKGSRKFGVGRKATKRRRTTQKYKLKIVNKLKKMNPHDLAGYMARKMKEQKVDLLERAIKIVGKDMCIHLFLKTLKIEKRGGLLVKNQERRRTAGGVFLYLIRGDRRFPKSQIDLIFVEDRQLFDKRKKQKLAHRRLQKKALLENELMAGTGAADDSSMDPGSDVTTAAPDQDGTDTGHFGDDSTQESTGQEKDTTGEELCILGGMQCDGC